MQAKKILGLSCGRKNGNSEILLKEALMAAEALGVETEIIRAMDHTVKPCTGCEACSMTLHKGGVAKCAIKDDDVPWILEKTVVEDCALIIAAPIYHLLPNSHLVIINHRMLPTMFNNPRVLEKTRVGGIICVGGGEPDWTTMGLTVANVFLQHTRKLVDQIQVNYASRPGHVLVNETALARARKLGQNIGMAVLTPIEDVKYMGDEQNAECPVCHCNVLQVQTQLPKVVCPVCDVHGELVTDGGAMKVVWNEDDVKFPRFSPYGVKKHTDYIANEHRTYFQKHHETVQELKKKYADWGKFVHA